MRLRRKLLLTFLTGVGITAAWIVIFWGKKNADLSPGDQVTLLWLGLGLAICTWPIPFGIDKVCHAMLAKDAWRERQQGFHAAADLLEDATHENGFTNLWALAVFGFGIYCIVETCKLF